MTPTSDVRLTKRSPDGSLEGITDIDSAADRAWALEINSWRRKKHTVLSTTKSLGSAPTSREAHQLVRLLYGANWFDQGYRVKEIGFTYRIIKVEEKQR